MAEALKKIREGVILNKVNVEGGGGKGPAGQSDLLKAVKEAQAKRRAAQEAKAKAGLDSQAALSEAASKIKESHFASKVDERKNAVAGSSDPVLTRSDSLDDVIGALRVDPRTAIAAAAEKMKAQQPQTENSHHLSFAEEMLLRRKTMYDSDEEEEEDNGEFED